MAIKRHRLAQRRIALGFTQEQLAERMGVDPTTVRRWESGVSENGPKPWLRPKLARHLQVSVEQLDDLLAEGEDTDTAELLVANNTSSALTGRVDVRPVEALRRSLDDILVHGGLGDASLDDWELVVLRYGTASRDRPAALLLADLTADVAELKQAMTRCHSAAALRRLTRVAAHLSGLMCLTLIKLDERAAFRGWARTARIAASEADDAVTFSWVLAQEAYGHFYRDDLGEAVTVAQHAQAVVPRTPCVGAVLAAALEARAQAVLGRGDEARGALRQAEAILARLEEGAVVASAFGYNEAQLRFHEGNALTHLRDTRAAWTAQKRALELVPAGDFMDRAFTRLDRAMCLANDGDHFESASYALETLLGLTEEQRQGIIVGRARQVADALPVQYRALPPVNELRDLIQLPATPKG